MCHLVIYSGLLAALFRRFNNCIKGAVRALLITYLALLVSRVIISLVFLCIPGPMIEVKTDKNDCPCSHNRRNDMLDATMRELVTLVLVFISSMLFNWTLFKFKNIEIILNREQFTS